MKCGMASSHRSSLTTSNLSPTIPSASIRWRSVQVFPSSSLNERNV